MSEARCVRFLLPRPAGDPVRHLRLGRRRARAAAARFAAWRRTQCRSIPPTPRAALDALTYLGGVRLTSSRSGVRRLFGDAGARRPVHAAERRRATSSGSGWGRDLAGSRRPVRRLAGRPGHRRGQGRPRQSKSLTSDPRRGTIWIGFESANAIWRYDGSACPCRRRMSRPRPMRDWDVNGGAEAMVRLTRRWLRRYCPRRSTCRASPATPALCFAGDPTSPASAQLRLRLPCRPRAGSCLGHGGSCPTAGCWC